MNLQLIFGMTVTNLSMYLDFGQYLMNHVLKCNPPLIEIPPEEEFVELKAVSHRKYPILKNMKLYMQKSPDQSTQEKF